MAKQKRLHANGPVLRAAREERGLNVIQAATLIDCGPETWRGVEKGWRFFKPLLAARCALEFGLPVKSVGGAEAVEVDQEFGALRKQKGGRRA